MDDWVEIRLRIPRSWRDELVEAADAVGLAHLSDLVRMILRGFLRNRYALDKQEALR